MKSFGIILIFALLVFSLLHTIEPEVKEVIKTEKVEAPPIVKKVPVEVVKEVPVVEEVPVVKEVPVIKEVVHRVEVIKEVPVIQEVYREPEVVNEMPPVPSVQNSFSRSINQERRFRPPAARVYPRRPPYERAHSARQQYARIYSSRPREQMVSRPNFRQAYTGPRMRMNHYYPRQPVFRPAFGRRYR
jgi:hypothetical protein